ncbi:uncharacterized protein M437DRAFT_81786 [Aureobasidium melanogenum CBS 110374]|uniref:Uncharacterized protein n=1 Tax=Aureobasidium melanogenum (strain CBS 110374) TaxID=1043003 RepID=A0A074VZI5_AURM1|nr:uncharacterized protein M437DRAFT_81786 [Aureobasidium melanogenum CBS 110374]KEQ65943.1 hypothetical protein M437DRAFT_81786 [Aureobasidium melanogenum CBS 110374]
MCPLDEKFEILIVREAGHYRAAIASKTSRRYLLSTTRLDHTVTTVLEFLLDVTAEYIRNKEDTFYYDTATSADEVDELDGSVPYTNNERTDEHICRSPSSSSSEYPSSSSGSPAPERATRESCIVFFSVMVF